MDTNKNERVSFKEAFEYAHDYMISPEPQRFNSMDDEQGFYFSDKGINDFWGITVDCPVLLHVYDSEGRHTGFNSSEGVGEENIPHSYYSGHMNDEETIIFFDPSVFDNVSIKIESFDEGELDLVLKQFVDGNMSSKSFRNVQITGDPVGYINMSHEGIENVISLDIDGDGIIDEEIESTGLPFAEFSYFPNFLTVNESITFDASYSIDLDGTIESLEWDFGDNTTGEGKIVTHNYTTPAVYNVTLTVTDDNGTQDACTETLIAIKPKGEIEVTVEPQSSIATPGGTLELNIVINSTENFDDIFSIYISPDDIPPDQQINYTWFDWVSGTVSIPAGEVKNVPLQVTIPANATTGGTKMFEVVVESVVWAGNASSSIVNITTIGAIKGDLNGDNKITPTDAAIALQLAVSGGWDLAADVSGDNRITSLDALMILQAAAGAIDL